MRAACLLMVLASCVAVYAQPLFLTAPRKMLASASVNNSYVIWAGGYDPEPPYYSSDAVELYDANTASIIDIGPLLLARDRLCAATVGTRAFISGGYAPRPLSQD